MSFPFGLYEQWERTVKFSTLISDAEGILTSRHIGKEATGKQEDSPFPAVSSPRMRLGGAVSLAGRVSGLDCSRLVLDMFQLA